MAVKALQITVKGKVQGVFFRKYAKRKADELGIKGKIKNNVDGSVTIFAEQEEEVLAKYVAWCHEGSPFSFVNEVLTEETKHNHYRHFSIA